MNAPEAALDYSRFLASHDELLKANAIIEQIAPDDTPGLPAAHEQRAIAFSKLLSRGASSDYLRTLGWHLKQAGDPNSEGLWLAWANYYRLSGQIDRSVRALEGAATTNPDHWFSAADLYLLDGNMDFAKRSLIAAANAYRLRLGKNPLSIEDRVQLALALARLGEHSQASETLRAGLELAPGNAVLLKGANQLEIAKLEQRFLQSDSFAERLDSLREMLTKSQDPSNVYPKTVDLWRRTQSQQDRDAIKAFLDEALNNFGPNPNLYFAKSVFLLAEQKIPESKAILELTIQSYPEHGLSLNNLAWLLANQQPKDLPRAKEMAERAVASNPSIPTFHDTLGAIYLDLNDLPRAIQQLEIALADTPVKDRYKIHEKLARAYESVGNRAIAELHREKSKPPR